MHIELEVLIPFCQINGSNRSYQLQANGTLMMSQKGRLWVILVYNPLKIQIDGSVLLQNALVTYVVTY